MKFKCFWYNSHTGVHVAPEPGEYCALDKVLGVIASLTGSESFLGLEISDSNTVQMLRQNDGTWWLEKLSPSEEKRIGTTVNTAMAERMVNLIYLGDFELKGFSDEFPFLKWEPVGLGRMS